MRAKAPAQVRVLPVHEVTLVEAAGTDERVATDEHARTRRPSPPWSMRRPPCRQSHSGVRRPVRKRSPQRTRPSEQTGQHVGIATGVPLRRSVGVADEWRGNRAPRVGIQRRHERRQRARHQLTVGFMITMRPFDTHESPDSRRGQSRRSRSCARVEPGQTPLPRPRCRRQIRCRPRRPPTTAGLPVNRLERAAQIRTAL